MSSVLNKLIEYSETTVLKKKSLLVGLGDFSNQVYLLKKGVIRHYVLDQEGNEKTIRLSKEGDFFYSSIVSFFRSEPSYIICEALTEVDLIVWKKQVIDELAKVDRNIEQFRYQKLTEFIVEKHKRELSLISHSAEKRFKDFLEENGVLFNQIPHYIIASYLNITPEMLSRLRRKCIS